MQSFKTKLWSAATIAATAATLSATAVAQDMPRPSEAVFPSGFDRALSLMLAGEGGEGGLGVQKVWPTLLVPALDADQITQAVSGNSLTMAYHYTFQFATGGDVGGYNIAYTPVELGRCPTEEVPGDGLLLYEGVCSQQTNEPISGTWKVEDDRLCINANWASDRVEECFNVFFMLDSVALVKSDGSLWHKAHKLKQGAAPDM